MWQRFTERARRVVFFAQEEAGRLGENYVSTEHLLLGLVRENDSVAARILDRLGVSLARIRAEIERQVTRGDGRLGQDMQLTPRAKRVIDLAYDEARQLNNNYIGSEHLLLGLIREGEGMAGRVLAKLGVSLDRVREEVLKMQDSDLKLTDRPSGQTATALPPGLFDALKRFFTQARAGETPTPPDPIQALLQEARTCIESDAAGLKGKSLLSMADLSHTQLVALLKVTAGMAAAHRAQDWVIRWAYPKSLACIFEKPSLRTRVTFELGMQQLGGLATVLGPAEIGLGTRESVPDAARNLERWTDAIMARVFDHQTLVGLRDNCHIPVINGLSDVEHPCQCLADLFTLMQKKGQLEGLKVAWVGDGNNVLHSLLLAGAMLNMTIVAACPEGYMPSPEIVAQARSLLPKVVQDALAQDWPGMTERLVLTTDPAEAVKDADAVYTDVWTSMGQEAEAAERRKVFEPYRVTAALMTQAKPDALFMHCLPAHRGEEVADEVLDGPQSVVFDQAENRLHAQKAVLALLIGQA